MPKVYITNYNPNFTYEAAEEFGDTVHMTEGVQSKTKIPRLYKTFKSYAERASQDDIVLLSGTNLVCAIATAAWLSVHPRITVLQHTTFIPNGETKPQYIMHEISHE